MSDVLRTIALGVALVGCGPSDAAPEPSATPSATPSEPAPPSSCPDPYDASCVDEYIALAKRLAPNAEPVLADLRALSDGRPVDRWSTEPAPDSLTPEGLDGELRRRLGWDALMGTEPGRFDLVEGPVVDGVRQLEVGVTHAALGSFDATLRLPATKGPVPILLVLPGHLAGDSFDADVLGPLGGQRLLSDGFGLLIAHPRGADAEAVESRASLALIAGGHSLVGVHAAEAWWLAKALDHLRAVGRVPPGRTGLLGHSSGALAGNVLCHLKDAPWQACANDLVGDYLKLLCEGERCWALDETDPKLIGLRNHIARPPPIPSLDPRPAYGWPDAELDRVAGFFKEQLK